jgi:hypothetical protein
MLGIAQLKIFLLPVHNTRIKMYITVILFAVLYGCKIWLLELRDELRPGGGGISEQDI